MKYLGIDYGKTKMGLALSEGLAASPLKVLPINSLEDALAKIRQIVEKEGIERVVVGVPESGEARKVTDDFVERLDSYTEVVTTEETLSTQQAIQKMIKLGKGKKARSKEDAEAAAIILQEYLDNL